MTKSHSNYVWVEELRVASLLGVSQMAELIGVKRATYWNWMSKGLKASPINEKRMEDKLAPLSVLVRVGYKGYKWPYAGAIDMDADERFILLKSVLTDYNDNRKT